MDASAARIRNSDRTAVKPIRFKECERCQKTNAVFYRVRMDDSCELCGAYGSFGAGFLGGPVAGVANGCGLVAGYAGELCWGMGSGFWNYGWDFGNAIIGR